MARRASPTRASRTSRIRRVNRANRSMVRMTAIMAANILRKVRRERKTLRISMRRTASHKANRTRTRTTARTPTIRTMARTASRHGGRTVGGIRRTANRIAKRAGSRMVQSQPGWQQTNWYVGNFSPFRLIEEWLPEKAKTKIRIIYGVVGVAAIALGAALLLVPNKTLALAALLLGVYFVISGVVRIVSALVEPGLPGGWRVLDVFVGILLTFGGVVVVRNYGMTGQTLALLITLMVGFGWIMEGVLSLVESWRIPHSGWAIAYAIISIIAGFVVLMSPLSSAVFMIIFGGCAMVVMGITSVIRAFTFGKRRK